MFTWGRRHRKATAGAELSAGWAAAGTQTAELTSPHSLSPICTPSPAKQDRDSRQITFIRTDIVALPDISRQRCRCQDVCTYHDRVQPMMKLLEQN